MSNIKKLSIILILTGIIFALETYIGYDFLYKFWPIFILIMGIGFIKIYKKRSGRDSLFLVIGIYVLCFGLLAIFLNFTSWTLLAKLWPIFIGFFGISFLAAYYNYEKNKFYFISGIFFLILSAVFFIVFNISGHFWWISLIFLGIILYILDTKK